MKKTVTPLPRIKWEVEQRLKFIEFRLYWEGKVNRQDIQKFFGISTPQASSDLNRYQEIAPGNTEYDKRNKSYVRMAGFKPMLGVPTAEQYLSQLHSVEAKLLSSDETFIGQLPAYDIMPGPQRTMDTEVLRKVVQAIKEQQSLEVEYQSMSRPEPIWRWITPHALAFDGSRWHIRAYCHTHQEFRDFVPARILDTGQEKPHKINVATDIAWHQIIEVKIGPNPDLTAGQIKVVERDYGMENGILVVTVRAALIHYLLGKLGFYRDQRKTPLKGQQIILLNRKEIQQILEVMELQKKVPPFSLPIES